MSSAASAGSSCGAIRKVLLATLLITDEDALVGPDEIGLSEPAFRRFAEPVGQPRHGKSRSLRLKASMPSAHKIQGRTLKPAEIEAIISDLTHYRYSDMEIAAFLIGSASFMTSGELLALVAGDGAGRHAIEMAETRSSSTSIASAAFRATAPR